MISTSETLKAASAPRCPECGFAVFNRRYPKCESCGAMLPESIVYSAVERHALLAAEEELALERSRNEKAASVTTPGSLDDGLVSAVMGLTER